MLPTHRYYAKWDMNSQLDWAMSIGEYTHQFLQTLLTAAKNHDVAFRISNSIKQLLNEYEPQRLESACQHAIQIGATNSTSLRNILKNKLDLNSKSTSLEVSQADFDHQNIRGNNYYH